MAQTLNEFLGPEARYGCCFCRRPLPAKAKVEMVGKNLHVFCPHCHRLSILPLMIVSDERLTDGTTEEVPGV
jgi:hypothetical protein